MKTENYILTVLGKDRPGIIAKVTHILSGAGCNLEDVTMTILEGEFTMMAVFSIEKAAGKTAVEISLKRLEKKEKLTFFWKKLDAVLKHGDIHARGARNCLITATGRDRVGIVYQMSALLARFKLNITSLNSKILGYSPHAIYSMILEVDVPRRFSLSKLARDLKKIEKKLKIEIRLREAETIEM